MLRQYVDTNKCAPFNVIYSTLDTLTWAVSSSFVVIIIVIVVATAAVLLLQTIVL